MCGLAGIILKQKDRTKKELEKISSSFKEMLIEADSRGGHATGFAMIDKHGDYLLCKKNQDAYRFLEDDQVDNNIDSITKNITCLMGHTRYATLGSPSINKNNHPIRAGNTIGTHNGSIHNHKELFSKFEMERYAQVDSEAIFRLYETSQSAKDFSENRLPLVRGRVAIVWADLEYPNYVYIVKANNPLEMVYISELDVIVYGSTNVIINAGNWGIYEPISIKANTMMRINTRTLSRRTKTITITQPIKKKSSYYNKDLGIYQKTVSNFVPRYSWKDKQRELFKKYLANDGSTIRR
tara:strand:+ start:2324 stop:3211 length:888 start_codon:yes stop_codon:yes gene_type:complete